MILEEIYRESCLALLVEAMSFFLNVKGIFPKILLKTACRLTRETDENLTKSKCLPLRVHAKKGRIPSYQGVLHILRWYNHC